ncbi:hypothetical protein [Sphingobium sp.]|uniref:hypothetical protein n=1 Tax=Sphingobium sp. TaxID=1912891 RepID=UPI000DB15F80|nr:hypothetical protein [Sphingobium sp.]PZU67211.1 MAG: hypothetical protein DI540_11515 [Sphingobium sp.]
MFRFVDSDTIALKIMPNMYESLDDQQFLCSEDDPANMGGLRDKFHDFYRAKGFDAYKDDNGDLQPWFAGCDLPLPVKRLTDRDEKALAKQFFHKRIKDHANRTIALQTAKEAKYRYSIDPKTYDRSTGEVMVKFTKPEQALLFKLAFKKEAA